MATMKKSRRETPKPAQKRQKRTGTSRTLNGAGRKKRTSSKKRRGESWERAEFRRTDGPSWMPSEPVEHQDRTVAAYQETLKSTISDDPRLAEIVAKRSSLRPLNKKGPREPTNATEEITSNASIDWPELHATMVTTLGVIERIRFSHMGRNGVLPYETSFVETLQTAAEKLEAARDAWYLRARAASLSKEMEKVGDWHDMTGAEAKQELDKFCATWGLLTKLSDKQRKSEITRAFRALRPSNKANTGTRKAERRALAILLEGQIGERHIAEAERLTEYEVLRILSPSDIKRAVKSTDDVQVAAEKAAETARKIILHYAIDRDIDVEKLVRARLWPDGGAELKMRLAAKRDTGDVHKIVAGTPKNEVVEKSQINIGTVLANGRKSQSEGNSDIDTAKIRDRLQKVFAKKNEPAIPTATSGKLRLAPRK